MLTRYGELMTPYYNKLAEEAAARGLLCFAHDHVGHGRSEGETVQASSMDEYVDPVIAHCKEMVAKHPSLPLYILGHSMGGLITLLTVLREQDDVKFAGMVLMGPLIELDPNMAGCFMKFLASVMSKVAPGFSLKGVDTKLVTSDKEWQSTIDSDALHYHGGAKALQGHVIIQCLDSLPKQFSKVTLPYLILHGGEDKICTPSGSEALHAAASSQDKTLKVRQDIFSPKICYKYLPPDT